MPLKLNSRKGITLVELVLALAIAGGIMLIVSIAYRQADMIFTRNRVRSKAILENRVTLETLVHMLQQGKSGSWKISNVDPTHPYSRVDFKSTAQAETYAFYWADGGIFMKPAEKQPVQLASHVTWLLFTGDTMDPGLLRLSLRMDIPVPGSKPYTLLISNREVHLTP